MMRRNGLLLTALAVLITVTGCRTATSPEVTDEWWDASAAELLEWTADDPAFEQIMALEGSGLTVRDGILYAVSEKYARLLRIDSETLEVEVDRLDVPIHTELEGITLAGDEAFMCDEAHAAVYRVALDAIGRGGDAPVTELSIVGAEIEGGKEGLEGLTAVDGRSDLFYLLLERSGNEATGCRSTIFPLRRVGDEMVVRGDPLIAELEDCNWRLTGLFWWKGRLLGLKTRYPGPQRYEVVVVDPETGELTKVLDATDLLVAVPDDGWTNNVEGIAVDDEGALWLLGDNAVTGVIDDPAPPRARQKTLLVKLPPTAAAPLR